MSNQSQKLLINPSLRTTSEIADELDALYLHSGDPCCERAARVLRQGTNPGRKAIDDNWALQEVDWLMDTGKVATLNRAFLQVAAAHEPLGNPRSVAERLRQKYFRNRPNNSFLDQSSLARCQGPQAKDSTK